MPQFLLVEYSLHLGQEMPSVFQAQVYPRRP